jgi:hypothetical protein
VGGAFTFRVALGAQSHGIHLVSYYCFAYPLASLATMRAYGARSTTTSTSVDGCFVGWEGIFICCPEFTFNDLLVQHIKHSVSDKCIEKYTAHGWHELVWKDTIVHMEQVDGLNFRLQNAHHNLIFTPIGGISLIDLSIFCVHGL